MSNMFTYNFVIRVQKKSKFLTSVVYLTRHSCVNTFAFSYQGTDKVKSIIVWDSRPYEQMCSIGESFSKLKRLQIFIISTSFFSGDQVDYLSNELRVLDWYDCPLRSFPSSFNPQKLVILKMQKWSSMPSLSGGLEVLILICSSNNFRSKIIFF